MEKNKKTKVSLSSSERSKRVFLIFTSAFLGCILLVGIIFGAIGIAKNTSAVMKYKNVYLGDGVASYLATSYKYDMMSSLTRMGIECYDSEYFWGSESEDGKTWGEVLAESTEKYLGRVIVGSYLFDRNARLTKNDKAVIEKAVDEVIAYRADGSVDTFNEMAKDMGFTYRDFKKAVEMLYKYEMAESVIFGYDGAALKSGGFALECEAYFEEAYSRVKLMFIRTEGEYATDPETGKQVYSEYDEATKAKIQEKIEYIRTLIYNTENDLVAEGMNEETFDWYIQNDHPTGTANDTEGYYFSSESSYSQEFAMDAPEVVRLALSMDVGHYAECEVDIGVCFIYKCETEAGAYDRIGLAHFFGDFYEKASSYVYSASLDAYLEGVTVKEKYNADAVITKPYNQKLNVKFG